MARPLVKPAFASSIHYAPPVQDISELANVDAASRADKQQRLVEDEGSIYHFDLESTAGDIDGPPPITVDTDGVVEPNDAPTTGRWLKIQGSIQDHGVLLGLGDDDHPQYLFLAGRFGGQTATGGTAIADVLRLRGSVAASGAVRVLDELQVGAGARITTAGEAIFNDSVLIGTLAPSGSELLNVAGSAFIDGKLTVTGQIDPVSLLLSGSTALFIESNDGSTASVSASGTGRLRYISASGWQVSSEGSIYQNIATGIGTLDAAYDQGGAGSGRIITTDAGPVILTGPSGLLIGDTNPVASELFLVTSASSILESRIWNQSSGFETRLTIGRTGRQIDFGVAGSATNIAFIRASVGGAILDIDNTGGPISLSTSFGAFIRLTNAGETLIGGHTAPLASEFVSFRKSTSGQALIILDNQSSTIGASSSFQVRARTNGAGGHNLFLTQYYANSDSFKDRRSFIESNRTIVFNTRRIDAPHNDFIWAHQESEIARLNASGVFMLAVTSPSGSELLHVGGDAYIDGKLTVIGAIDPTSLLLSGSTALFIESNNAPTALLSSAGTGRIRYLAASGWQVSSEGGTYENLFSGIGAPIDGVGTANMLAKFSDPNTIVSSQIFDNGSFVGINTVAASGSELFNVNGTSRFEDDIAAKADLIVDDQIFLADGTGSNPSITFNADTDTGIFRSVTNGLGIAASGNQVALFTFNLIDFDKLVQASLGIEIGGGQRIRSVTSVEMGIQVNNESYSVGSLGSLIIPVKASGAFPSDIEGGNLDGGLVLNNGENRVYVRTSSAWSMVHTGDTILPSASGVGTIGTSSLPWGEVNAKTVNTGDLNLKRGDADWTIQEEIDKIIVTNNVTGKKYRMVLEEMK